MHKSKIAGIGKYVPANVVPNNDLLKYMDTSDEWIQERTGIKERRYAKRLGETTATMGIEAAKIAIARAGTNAQEIDFIVFALVVILDRLSISDIINCLAPNLSFALEMIADGNV